MSLCMATCLRCAAKTRIKKQIKRKKQKEEASQAVACVSVESIRA